jgi:HEAT repeat protein
MVTRLPVAVLTLFVMASAGAGVGVGVARQAPPGEGLPADLPTAIGRLGSLDYATRTNAARVVRRANADEAVAALTTAVIESSDQFVRYRALVLLTGFNDRRTGELMRTLSGDRNDRLREVAYRWMAARPQPSFSPALMAALQTEQAEFVRPALVKALAALGSDPQVQRALVAEVSRGLDFFRLGVIDALGEFKATYALDALTAAAQVEGPLQDDAILALGRIGDRRSQEFLSALPATGEVGAAAQAALCLLGNECPRRVQTIVDAMVAPGARPEVVRSAVTALAVLGASNSDQALTALADLAAAAQTRDLAAIGFGGAALRNPERLLDWLTREPATQQDARIDVLRQAFERFEDDFAEEAFFAATRAAYWRAPEGSAARTLMATLIQKLEF